VAERVTNKEIALVEDHPTVHQDQEDQGQDLVHIQAEAQAVVEEEEMIEEITEEIGNIEIAEVIAEHQRALILEDTREAEAKNLREEENRSQETERRVEAEADRILSQNRDLLQGMKMVIKIKSSRMELHQSKTERKQ